MSPTLREEQVESLRGVQRLVALLALAVWLSIPGLHFHTGWKVLASDAETAVDNKARQVSRLIAEDPYWWSISLNQIDLALADVHTREGTEWVEVRLNDTALVASTGTPLAQPQFTVRAAIHDSGIPLGAVTLSVSLLQLLWSTALAALFSTLLAAAVYLTAVRYPLRRLADTLDKLALARDQAEAASRAKAAFLAAMSHEIRTPMNGVIGTTSLLVETPLTREQQGYVETIRDSGETLLTVINDILDYSKVESGHMELAPRAFYLTQCVDAVLASVTPMADKKSLELVCVIDGSVPECVWADDMRLRQVLGNLLGNAVKFTAAGEVVLQVTLPVPGRVQFSVRDTGIGISPDQLSRLFKPFAQADLSTTKKYGGTGLGLIIAQRLVALMGGQINVCSEPGAGSTFSFDIIAPRADSLPESHLEVSDHALLGKRVLLVDDNLTNLNLLGTLVDRWGMFPQLASSAAEALALVPIGTPFDIAVVDLCMPGTDGVELGRALRAHHPRLPLLLLSSAIDSGQALAPNGLFASCLAKPVRRHLLQQALVDALGDAAKPTGDERSAMSRVLDPTLSARAPLRVLVTDDNEINALLICTMLSQMGYSADAVADGRAAVDAVARNTYDLVLMDLNMPELDGRDATRAIRAAQQGRGPHIAAFTAAVMPEDKRECIEIGMNSFLPKPVTTSALRELLERVHAEREPAQA